MRQKEFIGWGCLIGIVLIIGGVTTFFETFGFIIPSIIVVVIITLWILGSVIAKKARKNALLEKYTHLEIVEKIISKTIWQDETAEQVIDSLGEPLARDTKILKTKQKEIWKYNPIGRNRYAFRIILEDDVVVGWEQKTWE